MKTKQLKNNNVITEAKKLLETIKNINEINLDKPHKLHNNKPFLFNDNGQYKEPSAELIFYRLRDLLIYNYKKKTRSKKLIKLIKLYNFSLVDNSAELRLLCENKMNELKKIEREEKEKIKKDQIKEKNKAQEASQKLYYDSYEYPEKNEGNKYSDYKVKDVIEIFNIDEFPEYLQTIDNEKKKVQKIITSSDEVFYVLFSTQSAKGIRKYYIIDFEVIEGTNIIKRNHIWVGNKLQALRPITVFGILYPSVIEAYNILNPFYAYSTICQKTKNEKDPKKIDLLFEKTHSKNINIQGPKLYCKKRKLS